MSTEQLGSYIVAFSDLMWGTPLLVLLLGGGLFFLFYSRLAPLLYLKHAVEILMGRYDDPNEIGQINHYQALSTAIAGTVGMGNVSGVAIAISTGGPGAMFWMWVSAMIGVSTKFFTCTLAVMYRGKDSAGEVQGGPMYVIREGLGRRWQPLAVFFSIVAMIGVAPMFQANQLSQILQDVILTKNGITPSFESSLIVGIIIAVLVGLVIFGGIQRIGAVTGKLVPFMVVVYIISVLYILFSNVTEIIPAFQLIIHDAFTGDALLGGSLGSLIIVGVRRAAFSNEAGIGTAPMAHGAAKTNEPIREGLVAMLGPIIDTIIICTMTALAIIITGVWVESDASGITLTTMAFEQSMQGFGSILLTISVSVFALTTLFAYPYYGTKSFAFLFGVKYQNIYKILYILAIPLGTVTSLGVVISIFDSAYALMAFPTMISALLLAPKVRKAAKVYFKKLKSSTLSEQLVHKKSSSDE